MNADGAVWDEEPTMKPLIAHLNGIKNIRNSHTRAFVNQDFALMPRLATDIVHLWEGYRLAQENALQAGVCFTCCAKPKAEFTVESQGRLPMLFCSSACRLTFGVSLGLT